MSALRWVFAENLAHVPARVPGLPVVGAPTDVATTQGGRLRQLRKARGKSLR